MSDVARTEVRRGHVERAMREARDEGGFWRAYPEVK